MPGALMQEMEMKNERLRKKLLGNRLRLCTCLSQSVVSRIHDKFGYFHWDGTMIVELAGLAKSIKLFSSVLILLLTSALLVGCSSTSPQATDVSSEVNFCLGKVDDYLGAGDFRSAHDMILVALRLSPSDPRLIDVVEKFVESAMTSPSDEALSLAEDLLSRGDSLVTFQKPTKVEQARKQLSKLEEKYFSKEVSGGVSSVEQPDPFAEVKQLIKVATDAQQKLSVRTRAAERAKAALDDIEFSMAVSNSGQLGSWGEQQAELYAKIDSAEQDCLQSLCNDILLRKVDWEKTVASLYEEVEKGSNDQIVTIESQLDAAISSGTNLLQDITPYAKAELKSAQEASATIVQKLAGLQRRKNWLYNKQCLALIREIESKKDWTPMECLRALAEVKEDFLSPYILRRHSELWDIKFNNLEKEEIDEAVRLRILKSNE
jgi:hypothetical protein